jgi:beta-phosphoglucomutase
MAYRGVIFDLDGVIVDTAKYHYSAWRRLAEELGFAFSPEDNEQLKGVNRMRSLDIVLEKGGIALTEERKIQLAAQKNEWYKTFLNNMDQSEVLPGILEVLETLRRMNVRLALGSASKNAPFILEKLHLGDYFDAIVDGNSVSKAKPDPEVFLKAASALGLRPETCIVVEDAQAGIEAAKHAHMTAIGIGRRDILKAADYVIDNTKFLLEAILSYLDRDRMDSNRDG